MALPKIQYPTFSITVPSTKKKYRFRPFLVREEKILLMAKASGSEADILVAIKQVVNNCCLDEKFDVDKLSLFDLEYVFIKLRAQSVSDVVKVSYRDNEDGQVYDFDVNLNEVEVVFPDKVENVIKTGPEAGIQMKYPEASIYEDEEFLKSGEDSFFQLIVRCMDKIFDGDKVYDCSKYARKDLEDYLEGLDVKTFEAVREFMASQPTIRYTIRYRNQKGSEREINLTTLSDFFTLR